MMEVIQEVAPQVALAAVLLWMTKQIRSIPGFYWLLGCILLGYSTTLIQQVTVRLSSYDHADFLPIINTLWFASKACFVFFVYGIYTTKVYGQDDSKKMFCYKARITRSSFWIISVTALSTIIGCVTSLINYFQHRTTLQMIEGKTLDFPEITNAYQVIGITLLIVTVLALTYISYTSSIKRLHDIGKSGVFCLLSPIPVIGQFLMLFLGLKRGTKDENVYGKPWNSTYSVKGEATVHSEPQKFIEDSRPVGRSRLSLLSLSVNFCFLIYLVYLCFDGIRVYPERIVYAWLPVLIVNAGVFYISKSSGFVSSYLNRKALESQRVALEETQKIKELKKTFDQV